MIDKQKAYHIGEDRDPPYPFPDTTYHVTLYDRFFIRDTIFHHAKYCYLV